MDKPKPTRGLPNVVQMQSRIISLCILSPLRAGLFIYNQQVKERLLPFRITATKATGLTPYPIATLGSGRAMIFFLDSTSLWYSSNSVLSLNITVLDFALPVFSQEKPSLCL